jgi:hypothetical protein
MVCAMMACYVLESSELGILGQFPSGPGSVVGEIASDQADSPIIQGYIL